VHLPRTKKHLQKLTQNQRNNIANDGDDGPPGPDELDLQRGFGRPKIVHSQTDDEVSDYVAVRLALIRVKALHKYREIYYNNDSQVLNT
jgi:hypothetical protein